MMKNKVQLFIFVTLLIILPILVISTMSVVNFSLKGNDLVRNNISTIVETQSQNLNYFVDQQFTSLREISQYDTMRQLLFDNILNQYEYDKTRLYMSQLLTAKVNSQPYLELICLADTSGKIIISSNNSLENNKSAISNANKWSKENGYISDIIKFPECEKSDNNIVIGIPVYIGDDYAGFLYQVISMEQFNNFIKNGTTYSSFAFTITDKNGVIAASNDNSLIKLNSSSPNLIKVDSELVDNKNTGFFEYEKNNIKKIGFISSNKNNNLSFIATVDWDELNNPIINNIISILTLVFLLLIVVIFVIQGIYKYFSFPITCILKTIKQIENGDYSSQCKYTKNDEFGKISKSLNSLITSVNEKTKNLETANLKLKSITDNLPGGMVRCLYNEELDIIYFNEGFLKLVDCSKKQFAKLFQTKLINAIFIDDQQSVKKIIQQQINSDQRVDIQFRICNTSNDICWVHAGGSVVIGDDSLYLDFVLVDITEQKTAEENRLIAEGKYRLALSATSDSIFEANFNNDFIISTNKTFYDSYGNVQCLTYSSFIDKIAQTEVHPDDKSAFINKLSISNLKSVIKNGCYEYSCEFRKKIGNNNYIWTCCTIFLASNIENSDCCIIIGCFKNIDEKKKNQLYLLRKAERDCLTDVSNKGTTERLINEILSNYTENNIGALFIIDIDYFKGINDTLGHLQGDVALQIVANKLKCLFRSSDIIGRIGGDEFVVFTKDLRSKETITKLANELLSAFKDQYIGDEHTCKITISIGIAVSPDHGADYNELLKKADIALYQSKKNGKNKYIIYSES